MTVTILDTWYEGATNKRIKVVHLSAVCTGEEFVLTAAQCGLTQLYECSSCWGTESSESTVFGVASATGGAAGAKVRCRTSNANTWNTNTQTFSTRLVVRGL